MNTTPLAATLAASLVITFAAFAADETVNTDLGTLDKEKTGQAFKKRP